MKQPFMLVYLDNDGYYDVQYPVDASETDLQRAAALALYTVLSRGGDLGTVLTLAENLEHVERKLVDPPAVVGRG